jgi:hypothetical protein
MDRRTVLASPIFLAVTPSAGGADSMPQDRALTFILALQASEPAPDRADKLALYGRFIGDWDAEIVTHGPNSERHTGQGEIHFGWVLEGRAIQDVWMIPPKHARGSNPPPMPIAGNWYGTTLRIYDPKLDAWRIFWIDPATNSFMQQIGRPAGADIVQEGETENGGRSRWSFTEITPTSFHWKGEWSFDNGVTWRLAVEVLARRRRADA